MIALSQSEQIESLYETIYKHFIKPIGYPKGKVPKIYGINRSFLNDLLSSCVNLYNHIDSAIIVLQKTIPDIYTELQKIIEDKLIGTVPNIYDEKQAVRFIKPNYSTQIGEIVIPSEVNITSGLKNVLELLKKSLYYDETGKSTRRDASYLTAKYTFANIRGDLTHFLTRFDYVMMYPHRILLDRKILETGLKMHGFDRVIQYLESSEEYFHKQKYVEFYAMARNAIEETINNASSIKAGCDHGFANNLKKLHEIGFLKGTFLKQIKEFRGSLSAGGSHPPKEEISSDETKLLLDNLYGFLGFIAIRLSHFKKE